MRSVRARFARVFLLTLKINAAIQAELGPVVFSPLVTNYSQQVEVSFRERRKLGRQEKGINWLIEGCKLVLPLVTLNTCNAFSSFVDYLSSCELCSCI
jgi:hypothetical protein